MRVLFNTYPVAFDVPGGGEIQLLRSREALQRSGCEVSLYDQWEPMGRPDVVHYFSVFGGSMAFCAYAKSLDLPLALSPVLWVTEENRSSLPMDEIHDLLQIADVILPNSQIEADALAAEFNLSTSRFTVTHNAVDSVFSSSIPRELFVEHFSQKRPFVLCVANIEPRKNQLRLIRALKRSGISKDYDLILLGGIRDRALFDECMREGADFTRHLGSLDHASELLRSAYRACDLFALPSLLETPGLAALEAAASGARILVTREGCSKEYFQNQATYVDPLCETDIENQLESALNSPGHPTLAKRISHEFSWDRTANQLMAAYNQIARTSHA